jgi:hypothetical protein
MVLLPLQDIYTTVMSRFIKHPPPSKKKDLKRLTFVLLCVALQLKSVFQATNKIQKVTIGFQREKKRGLTNTHAGTERINPSSFLIGKR